MRDRFKISTDGKATSSPPGNVCFPCIFAKITRAEFSSEERSDSLQRSRMSKTWGKERIEITSLEIVRLELVFTPCFLAWKYLLESPVPMYLQDCVRGLSCPVQLGAATWGSLTAQHGSHRGGAVKPPGTPEVPAQEAMAPQRSCFGGRRALWCCWEKQAPAPRTGSAADIWVCGGINK